MKNYGQHKQDQVIMAIPGQQPEMPPTPSVPETTPTTPLTPETPAVPQQPVIVPGKQPIPGEQPTQIPPRELYRSFPIIDITCRSYGLR